MQFPITDHLFESVFGHTLRAGAFDEANLVRCLKRVWPRAESGRHRRGTPPRLRLVLSRAMQLLLVAWQSSILGCIESTSSWRRS